MDKAIESLQKKFDQKLQQVARDFSNLKNHVIRIDNVLRGGKEVEKLNKSIENSMHISEKKFNAIAEEMGKIDVRRIDLAKLESRLNALRNELDKFTNTISDVQQLKENFIIFRKKALTKYNFSRLERWMKEIEKELLELISIKGEVSGLSADYKSSISGIKKMLEKHDKIINKFKRKEHKDISRCEEKLSKQISSLSDNLNKTQQSIAKLAAKTQPAKKTIKKKKRLSKKGNFFVRIKHWLLEETK
jgi:predicted RNase H-like nuclease (RuvC/YqgF family)